MHNLNQADLIERIKNRYTSVGCYPLFAIMNDGGCLCHSCVKEESENILESTERDGWRIEAIEVNWESLIMCDHCSKQIEAAYDVVE
jgi:hypothetical protein